MEFTKVNEVIRSVWNNHGDEQWRKDQSHYRGIGRWQDDNRWQRIGRNSVERTKFLHRMTGRPAIRAADVLTESEGFPVGMIS